MKAPIPGATVQRLPLYRECLDELPAAQETISSEQLAAMANVNSAKVRKDLSYLGSYGVRGVGYSVEQLRSLIERRLGGHRAWPIAIVGAGNLGAALANYPGFIERGFRIAGIFDTDQKKVGTAIGGVPIEPIDALEAAIAERDIAIGIVATPAAVAQEVAEVMARGGVRSILNFAPTILHVPPGVEVRRVDLSTELQILSFYMSRDRPVE